jgi:iron only hydrogenase large subunit-like protein
MTGKIEIIKDDWHCHICGKEVAPSVHICHNCGKVFCCEHGIVITDEIDKNLKSLFERCDECKYNIHKLADSSRMNNLEDLVSLLEKGSEVDTIMRIWIIQLLKLLMLKDPELRTKEF